MARQPEGKLVGKVKAALEERGARVVKIVASEESYQEKGISDLLVCYRGFFIAMEVKTNTGAPSPLQRQFLLSVRRAGGLSAVVRSVAAAIMLLDQCDERVAQGDSNV